MYATPSAVLPEANKPTSPAREESSANLLIAEVQAALGRETGLQGEYAAIIASAIVRGLRKSIGSQQIYVPAWPGSLERNQRIREQFRGNNLPELAARWNLSVDTIRRIVASQQAADRAA